MLTVIFCCAFGYGVSQVVKFVKKNPTQSMRLLWWLKNR